MDKARILIVDDERSTLDAMCRFLKRRFEVTPAHDGAEAVKLIGGNDYDLILTDLRMPGTDGMKVLEASLEKNPQPLCIILSAYGTVENAVEAVKHEARRGETVLLSPGAASYDQFENFVRRGEVFASLVK